MFKTETQYALRATAELARQDGALSIGQLAERSNAPGPMLAKVFYRLSQQGLVIGRPGPGGGYKLARPAEKIKLAEIVQLTEGSDFGHYCLFGLPECSDDEPCPLHEVWGPVRQRIFDMLDNYSVADLASRKIVLK